MLRSLLIEKSRSNAHEDRPMPAFALVPTPEDDKSDPTKRTRCYEGFQQARCSRQAASVPPAVYCENVSMQKFGPLSRRSPLLHSRERARQDACRALRLHPQLESIGRCRGRRRGRRTQHRCSPRPTGALSLQTPSGGSSVSGLKTPTSSAGGCHRLDQREAARQLKLGPRLVKESARMFRCCKNLDSQVDSTMCFQHQRLEVKACQPVAIRAACETSKAVDRYARKRGVL